MIRVAMKSVLDSRAWLDLSYSIRVCDLSGCRNEAATRFITGIERSKQTDFHGYFTESPNPPN